MGGKVSWKKIETEYITGRISVKKLAEKYGISQSTITKRSSSGDWSKKRREYRESVIKKTADKIADAAAEKLKKEYDIACSMGAVLEKALCDEKQFYRHMDMYGREHEGNIIDTKRLADAAKALKDLADIKKLAGGIITEFEKRKLELEEKRIDTKKGEQAGEGEGGVIILPEIENDDECENDMETTE